MRHLKTAFKICFIAVIFYYLSSKNLMSIEALQTALSQWHLIAFVLLLSGVCVLLATWRWNVLLRAQGHAIGFFRTFELVMIGNFFNVALPGAVSGDFVKAFYIGKDLKGHQARVFGSIFFDRVLGLAALVFLAAGATLLGMHELQGSAVFLGLRYAVVLSASVVIAFFAYLFLVRENHDPLLWTLKKIEQRLSRAGSLTRVYLGIRHYHHHRFSVLRAMLISLSIHSLVCVSFFCYAYALGETQLSKLSLVIIVPMGLLVTAVPITPAGIGTGHVAFSGLFHLLDSQQGANIFNLYMLSQLFYSLLGGLFYLRYKERAPEVLKNATSIAQT